MSLINLPVSRGTISRIGVVGLGRMGSVFATNLLENGYAVTVHDRDAERVSELGKHGAFAAGDVADLATCDLVITSLPNDAALTSVTLAPGGLLETLGRGAVHVSTSTVSPGAARQLAERHQNAGQLYVSAPVLGNPDLARARKLFVLASGAQAGLDRASPVLQHLGQRVFTLGDDPGAANIMKLGGNVLTALTLQSMGEVLALLRKCGIEGEKGFEVLTQSLFDGKVHKAYGGKIVEERHTPGMAVPLAVKDLRLALAEAEAAAVPMPAASIVHDRLVAMMGRGWSGLDWSALGLLAAVDAGLPVRTKPASQGG